ncbi:hypothetical protein [Peribacillus frigoritolerans]|uniref:hypothetical protein n=1 Tax=Peribacillus frigoritolerans TaxID=450367 RepID=UPI003305CFA6
MKKFATLLLNNWLVETPQTLGRQSAERERISEINSKLSTEKLCEYKIPHSFYFWLCACANFCAFGVVLPSTLLI